MAACGRVYDSRHLQTDCQELGSAPEPYARQSSMGYLYISKRYANAFMLASTRRETLQRANNIEATTFLSLPNAKRYTSALTNGLRVVWTDI